MDDHRAAYPLQDAQGDVVSLIHMPLGVGASTAEVAAQWTYSPYGEVLTYEQFHPHPVVVFGHKSLVVDRIDTPPVSWDTDGGTLSDTQRLVPGAKLISYARNRTYAPSLGRWLQQDPIRAGTSPIGDSRYHGDAMTDVSLLIDAHKRIGNGLNLFGYLGQNPLSRNVPLGLSWDPFDNMVDDFAATNAAQQAAFMEQLRGGFNAAAHLAWQVAQLHPAVGMAVAGYNLATGNFSTWDLLALIPGGVQAKAFAKAGAMLGKVRGAYETTAVAGLVSRGVAKVGRAASKLPDAFLNGPKNTWVYLGWKEGVPV